ncbi:MAG: nitroreductase family protein [Planctomycetes bacterium]|nr:nitroreductase family protein [Planctomycetota bacterium]
MTVWSARALGVETLPARCIPYHIERRSIEAMHATADALLAHMRTRRSCRFFSDEAVPRDLIEKLIAIAHTAPSGANRQPWRFVAVDDAALKHEIRLAAEAEERISYQHRMPEAWLAALEPIGTNAEKPYLEIAPWLVVVFRIDWEMLDGKRQPNYYPFESAAIAAGMFSMACHQVGLATLTHTPSPMKFLREILGRPVNEKPFLLVPVGYPADDCVVPDIPKKPLDEVLQWNKCQGAI